MLYFWWSSDFKPPKFWPWMSFGLGSLLVDGKYFLVSRGLWVTHQFSPLRCLQTEVMRNLWKQIPLVQSWRKWNGKQMFAPDQNECRGIARSVGKKKRKAILHISVSIWCQTPQLWVLQSGTTTNPWGCCYEFRAFRTTTVLNNLFLIERGHMRLTLRSLHNKE